MQKMNENLQVIIQTARWLIDRPMTPELQEKVIEARRLLTVAGNLSELARMRGSAQS